MSSPSLGIAMIGCGTVGGGIAMLLRDQADLLADRCGVRLDLRHVLVRDSRKLRDVPLAPGVVTTDPEALFQDPAVRLVVEVAGGRGVVSQYVRRALSTGRHVVTANKALLSTEGPELFALARSHGGSIAFEASCCGGIPVITALQFGLMANEFRGLVGILNGTCNYILTEMTRRGRDYATALAEAQHKGYAEADPTLDVSGRDAGQKLAVLATLAFGRFVSGDAVRCQGIDQLDLCDIRYGAELGYDVKLLGIAEHWPGERAISADVQPCFVRKQDLLAQVDGAYNALMVTGHATGPTLYYGAGAGRMPTAGAVMSDILNVAAGWYPQAFDRMTLMPRGDQPASLVPQDELWSRYYLRFNALDVPGVMAKMTTILGNLGISLSSVLQHEANAGQVVPVVIMTHQARRGDVVKALAMIEALDVIRGRPVMIRIVDLPRG